MTPAEPLVRWDWIAAHLGEVVQRLGEHVVLTVIAVVAGFALSFLLSLVSRRYPGAYGPITWAGGVLYTIPSLALFALLIPVTGLTLVTAEIGLVSYTLLILTRSIVGGLQAVPAEVRETAIGLGYTGRQLFWQVELPLAIPIIVAGVRVATVSTVGLVTVTALIGQGGLGYFILDGLLRFFSTPLILGAGLSILLAALADAALVLTQRALTPWAGRAPG